VERSLATRLVGDRCLQSVMSGGANILLGLVHVACELICLKSLN
jgi:hypothetical protein